MGEKPYVIISVVAACKRHLCEVEIQNERGEDGKNLAQREIHQVG